MKIRNKLILSCAALAAVATTAVSTTFAWYTSNTTVTATGVTAGTDAENSSTLQIGKLGTDWGSTVDIDIDAGKFDPVSYGANGNGKASDAEGAAADTNFYLWGSDAVSDSVAAANTNYVQFHLYFRNLPAADADHVLLKSVTLKNATTGALPTTQTLVTDGLLATGKTRTDVPAYSVDLLRALSLKLDYVQKTFADTDTFNAAAATDADVASTSGSAIYSLDAFHTDVAADDKKADSIDSTTNTKGTSANAHTYYNAVKGSNIATSNPLVESTDLGTKYANENYTVASKANAIDLGIAKGTQKVAADGTATALAASYVYTTWTIFLNGWDTMCFDGVKGQKITLSLTFATNW